MRQLKVRIPETNVAGPQHIQVERSRPPTLNALSAGAIFYRRDRRKQLAWCPAVLQPNRRVEEISLRWPTDRMRLI
jgi:hypothetical protein